MKKYTITKTVIAKNIKHAIKIEKTVEPVSIQYEDDVVYNTNKMGFTK